MTVENIYLPEELRGYMDDCKAEPGSREWFQSAFYAVAACATNDGDYLTEEFERTLGDQFADSNVLYETLEEMKRMAGLDSLC